MIFDFVPIWTLILGLAVFFYVLLDGFDVLGARYVAVRSADQGTQGADELVDIDGTLLAWMRGFGVTAIAVRPDKFVAAADTFGLAVPA